MKKLYFLNEEEKNRILNIHRKATKRQYLLKEESIPKGTLSDDEYRDFKSILSYGDKGGNDETNARDLIDAIPPFCKNISEDRTTLPTNTMLVIVKEMDRQLKKGRKNIFLQSWYRGVTNEAQTEFKKGILELGNIPNFCYAVMNGDASESGESRVVDIFDEVDTYYNRFQDYIVSPLQTILEKSKPTASTNVETDPVSKKETGNLLAPILKKHKEMLDAQEKSKNSSTYYSPGYKSTGGSGWTSINSKYDKEILQALGKTGEKLTDEDIKDIYNKLKNAGKIK